MASHTTSPRAPLSRLALTATLAALWSPGCGLFSTIEEPTCDDLPTTCVCPGGQTGQTTCDPDSLTIESCDCSAAMTCEESARDLCRCLASDDTLDPAIGLSACADPGACVCQEFVPPSTSSALVLPNFAGTSQLDGSCAEFGDAPIAPHAGFTSDETFARMSCRLMWHTLTDGSRQLLGCCLVPDDDVRALADAADPPSVRGADGGKGDDRVELTIAGASGTLHQIAINAQPAAPVIFSSTIVGQTTMLTTSTARAHVSLAGTPNDATPDTGYIIEWAWPLPDDLAALDAFSCQLSRYDVSAAADATRDQEHTFGINRTTPPTDQLGSCTLSSP